MVSINKIPRAIALLQNVEVGSPEWESGGLQAKSFNTGGHAAYPWKLDHLVSPSYQRRVLANYGSRPCYYLGDALRQVSYEFAGRPVNWTPDDAFDMTAGDLAGMRVFVTSKGFVPVNGIDIQHFHLTPLVAIYDAPPAPVMGLPELNSRLAAGCLIRGLMKSLAGMVAKLSPAPYDYPGDRASACIVKAMVHAGARGLVDAEDAVPLVAYLERALDIWFGPPHQYPSKKYADSVTPAVVVNPYHFLQVYNGLFWVLPPLYDLLQLKRADGDPLVTGALRDRVQAIVGRFSQYMLDLELLLPGNSTAIAGVSFPDELLGAPLENWSGLTSANIHFADNAPVWGVRAQKVAARVLASDVLEKSSAKLVAEYAADEPGWCVDADGAYVGAIGVGTPA